MPATKFEVQQVLVDPDGLQISYLGPDDMKEPGLVRAHTLAVPRGADYDAEIDAVVDALQYLINDVMDDWETLKPLNADVPAEEPNELPRPERPVMGQ